MASVTQLVPSDAFPHGLAALEYLIADATSVSAAVAFVSQAGVHRLAEVVGRDRDIGIELIARGAGVTSPEALLALRDELGVDVSVVMGRHASAFHPKLWLIRSGDQLSVLSGSGNLTAGGLIDNDEQFEIIQVESGSVDAEAYEQRFDRLTANAASLNDVEGSAIWREWESVIKRQRALRHQLQRLEAQLNARDVIISREADRRQLLHDLDDLYEQTMAAALIQNNGRRYVPSRFKQGIERARAGGDPVLLVARICRRQTEGFDVILGADRADLTVEALVVNQTKPYHDLFTERTRQLSAERLRQFPSWRPDE
jgi:HKD family nuclease